MGRGEDATVGCKIIGEHVAEESSGVVTVAAKSGVDAYKGAIKEGHGFRQEVAEEERRG